MEVIPRGHIHGVGRRGEPIQVDELQVLVDDLAAKLKRSVAADDRRMHFLVASRHFGDQDAARVRAVLNRDLDRDTAQYLLGHGINGPANPMVLIPPSPERGLLGRRCFPIRWDKELLGFLWLIDTGDASGDLAAMECAHKMAMTMYGRSLRAQHEAVHREGLVRDLISSDSATAERAGRDLVEEGLLVYEDMLCVAVLEPEARNDTQAAIRSLREQIEVARQSVATDRLLLASVGMRVVAILPSADGSCGSLGADLATAVLSARRKSSSPLVVGLGDETAVGKAAISYRQARVAARAAIVLPGLGPVVEWRQLGIYGQLLQVALEGPAELIFPRPLLDLKRADKKGFLLETAEIFLDAAGDTAVAAEQLHIHRSTLHYRLSKIQEASGLNLESGQDRLTLHLGLKMLRLMGESMETFHVAAQPTLLR